MNANHFSCGRVTMMSGNWRGAAFLLIAVSAAVAGCGKKSDTLQRGNAHAPPSMEGDPEPKVVVAKPAHTPPVPTPEERKPYLAWSLERTAIDSLGRIGEPAVPAITRLLRSPDRTVRERAAQSLARIGPAAEAAVPDLLAALDDPDEDVRRSVIRALGQIGPAAADAVPALLGVVQQGKAPPAPAKKRAR
jgi:HEAT repeats/PBS lyase HEAT-like repeat